MTRVAGTWIRSNRIVGHAGSAGFLAADTTIAMAHWNVSRRSDRPGIPDATTPQKKPVPGPQTAFWEITPMKSASTSIGGLIAKRRWQSARDPHHFHVANPPGDSRAPDPGLEPRRTPFRDPACCLIHFVPHPVPPEIATF